MNLQSKFAGEIPNFSIWYLSSPGGPAKLDTQIEKITFWRSRSRCSSRSRSFNGRFPRYAPLGVIALEP